jgi:hypothetical protein
MVIVRMKSAFYAKEVMWAGQRGQGRVLPHRRIDAIKRAIAAILDDAWGVYPATDR